jgi:3-oxoacyl-[acyl-carrier protein] reductase
VTDTAAAPRSVIVTGASSGIGLACARRFLERGDRVVAQYRLHPEPVRRLVAEFGDRVVPVAADLGTETGCVTTVESAGRPHVLVHSAGIWNHAPIAELDLARLDEMFRVNTYSAFLLAREAAKVMAGGSMVFVGSTAGQRGEPGNAHYAASKSALWGLVQSLAQELAPTVRVNLVSPGWVRTPMTGEALAAGGREARITASVPLGRIAEAEDVAAAVDFLADDERARHLTGVDLSVSGGALLPMPRG